MTASTYVHTYIILPHMFSSMQQTPRSTDVSSKNFDFNHLPTIWNALPSYISQIPVTIQQNKNNNIIIWKQFFSTISTQLSLAVLQYYVHVSAVQSSLNHQISIKSIIIITFTNSLMLTGHWYMIPMDHQCTVIKCSSTWIDQESYGFQKFFSILSVKGICCTHRKTFTWSTVHKNTFSHSQSLYAKELMRELESLATCIWLFYFLQSSISVMI